MIAFHAVFSTYGFWLSNDPRGSNSTHVGSEAIFAAAGRATKVDAVRSVAAKPHNRRLRAAGRNALIRSPVGFSGEQARAVGRGFATAVAMGGHAVYACSILPEHVHLVIGEGDFSPGRVVGHFKRQASLRLLEEQIHPFQRHHHEAGQGPTCWGKRGRNVFLPTSEDVLRTIRYVEQNPVKEGKPRQVWSFVVPFLG